jgi:hypothetical protein
VPATVTIEPTKADPPLRTKAPMGGVKRTEAETTPIEVKGRNRRRSCGHQRKEYEPPAEGSEAAKKRSPAIMRLILDSLTEYAILSHAAEKAGIHRHTLKYWGKRSAAGDDGYDVEWRGFTAKFHEHFEAAMREAYVKVLDALMERANGYDQIVTHRGRVIYQMDEFLLGLGYQGRDAYRR